MLSLEEKRKRDAEARKRWRDRNPEKQLESYIHSKYGLIPERYKKMLALQGGRCVICQTEFGNGKYEGPCVDHDHTCCAGKKSCGKCIRGLICNSCNAGLGHFRDDPSRLLRAHAYVSYVGGSYAQTG